MNKAQIAMLLLMGALIPCLSSAQDQSTAATPSGQAEVRTGIAQTAAPASKTGKNGGEQNAVGTNNSQNSDSQEEDERPEPKSIWHVRMGTVHVGASYTHFSGPVFYRFFGYYGFYPYYGFYSPLFFSPFYGPYAYPAYPPDVDYGLGKGELKISVPGRQKGGASVFIDGAYAGPAKKLKSIWLDPGAYDISVKAADGGSFQQRIYVISGKKLELAASPTQKKTTPEEKR